MQSNLVGSEMKEKAISHCLIASLDFESHTTSSQPASIFHQDINRKLFVCGRLFSCEFHENCSSLENWNLDRSKVAKVQSLHRYLGISAQPAGKQQI